MKWKTPTYPMVGDKCTIQQFAFWPTDCDDGTTRWLEMISVTLEAVIDSSIPDGRPWVSWNPVSFSPLEAA